MPVIQVGPGAVQAGRLAQREPDGGTTGFAPGQTPFPAVGNSIDGFLARLTQIDRNQFGAAPSQVTLVNLIEAANRSLQEECLLEGKAEVFEQLKVCLSGDHLTYAELGTRLRMSEGAVKVAAHRLRQRYGHLLRMEVARTVASDEEIEEELQHLLEIVSR